MRTRDLVKEGKRIDAEMKKAYAELRDREPKLEKGIRDKAMAHLLQALPRFKWKYNAAWPALEAVVSQGIFQVIRHCFFKYEQPLKGYHGLRLVHRSPVSLLIVVKAWDVAQLLRFAIDYKLKADWSSIRLTSKVLTNTLELVQDLEQSIDGVKPVKLRKNSTAMKEVQWLVKDLTERELQ